jgi:hypothetical protein
MRKHFPNWRHWIDSSALVGLASVGYWVVIAIIGIAPMIESDSKWWLFRIGVALSLVTWYALAQSTAKASDADNENKELLRLAAASAASGPRIEAQNDTTHSLLLGLHELYQQKDMVALSGKVRVVERTSGATLLTPIEGKRNLDISPSLSGTGDVTVSPGTGAVNVEGFAPTVSVEALDEEIRRQEAAVRRSLRLHPGFPLRDSEGREVVDPNWVPNPDASPPD